MIHTQKIPSLLRSTLDWIKNNSPSSYGVIASIIFIIAGFSLLLSINHQLGNQLVSAKNRYGEQVAQTTANKLKQATVNNDLISMQAELNDLTQKETIITAIIYDINNIPKVQSGLAFDRLDSIDMHSSYSAAITQDENIIGQLTIFITQKPSFDTAKIFSSILFLTGLSALLFFLIKLKKASSANQPEVKLMEENILEAHEELNSNNTYLLIQFKNIDVVFKQLSKETRDQRYQDVLTSITKTLKIYNGEIIAGDAECLTIKISNNEETQAIINANYCAGLIKLIANKEQWLTKLNYIIYRNNIDFTNINRLTALQYIKQSHDNGIFIHKTLNDTISSMCNVQTLDKKSVEFLIVEKFNDKYRQLLENQCQHLTSSPSSQPGE